MIPARALALALALVAAAGCSRPSAPAGRMALEGEAAALLPADDGAHLVVLYGSELLGSLDGCGCMGNPQLGGLPYRSAFTEGFRTARPDVGVLQLDAGSSTEAVTNTSGKEVEDFVVADEWVVTALDRLGFDAANLTAFDMPFFARYLTAERWDAAVKERPVLGRYVSANIEPARAGLVAPPPYVVRSIAAPRIGATPLRVAIVGLSGADPTLEAACGFRTTDPATALANVLPRARAESDLVVVLAYMPAKTADRLVAAAGAGADLFVVASSISGDVPPRLDGAPRVTYAYYKTQNLGVLSLRLESGKIASARNDYVKMDAPLPRDEVAETLATSAKDAVRKVKERRFAEGAGSS